MSNSNEHFIGGALTAFVVDALMQKSRTGTVDLRQSISFGLLGGCVGLLPDILEPATNPNHRSFCHSATAGMGLFAVYNKFNENQDLTQEQKDFWLKMMLAYESHLALDSTTQRSLPII